MPAHDHLPALYIVPLSRLALTVLQQLNLLTDGGRFLFQNQREPDACALPHGLSLAHTKPAWVGRTPATSLMTIVATR